MPMLPLARPLSRSGMTSSWRPVRMRFLGAHHPNFIKLAERGLAHVRSDLGEPVWQVPMADTCYVDPFPPVLQPPDDQPVRQCHCDPSAVVAELTRRATGEAQPLVELGGGRHAGTEDHWKGTFRHE